MLSPSDTAIVFVLALLLFGPDQLPKLARQLGEAMRHIQNTTHTFMMEMERAADVSEPHTHEPAPIEGPHISDDLPLTGTPSTSTPQATEVVD
jgi:sec-independent protein translocase protein TatB